MKKSAIVMCMCLLGGCHRETAIDSLKKIKKPVTVFAKHRSTQWYDKSTMTVRDSTGKLVELAQGDELLQLIDRYNIGDTINY